MNIILVFALSGVAVLLGIPMAYARYRRDWPTFTLWAILAGTCWVVAIILVMYEAFRT